MTFVYSVPLIAPI